jgi:hypothetical protein
MGSSPSRIEPFPEFSGIPRRIVRRCVKRNLARFPTDFMFQPEQKLIFDPAQAMKQGWSGMLELECLAKSYRVNL